MMRDNFSSHYRRVRAEWLCARQGSARRIGGASAVAGKRLRGGGEEGLSIHLQPAAVTAARSHHPIRQVEVGTERRVHRRADHAAHLVVADLDDRASLAEMRVGVGVGVRARVRV